MESIQQYCEQWTRPLDNNFAVACYNQNTIEELQTAAIGLADHADCVTWNISAAEWHDAIAAALAELLDENEGR